VLRPNDTLDPRYLYFFANWQKFINYLLPLQHGNSPPAVLDSDIKAQPIPIAPSNEQRRIVARIDELFAEIAEGEAALERARWGLDTWRRALLPLRPAPTSSSASAPNARHPPRRPVEAAA